MFETCPKSSGKIEFHRIAQLSSFQSTSTMNLFPVQAIQMLVPNATELPESIGGIFSPRQNSYFIVEKVPLVSLIEKTFIEAFIRKGATCAITTRSEATIDNFVAVIPTGKLVVSLKKNVGGTLALNRNFNNSKRLKKCESSVPNNLTFTIDLLSPNFVPGKKKYEAVLSEFKKIDHLHFDLIIKWVPHESHICCTSIKDYFSSKGFTCNTYEVQHTFSVMYSVSAPKISFLEPFQELNSCSVTDFVEWLGAQFCGVVCDDPDDYISSFKFPEISERVGQMYLGAWKGLFTGQDVYSLLKEMRQIFIENSSVPYVAIMAHGYQDSWTRVTKEEHVISTGNKFMCIVLFPESKYWLYKYISN